MAVYKAVEWQSGSGRWYCIDTSNLVGGSAMWWLPCRILELPPEDFVLLLINKYKAEISWDEKRNVLLWSWDESQQKEMRLFKNMLNKKARERNFLI